MALPDKCFHTLFSLQQIGINKFVIDLWTAPETLIAVNECHFTSVDNSSKEDVWLKVVNFVREKIPKLRTTLREQILKSVYEIGREIANWKAFHELYLSDPNISTMLKKLVWTSAGTIDCLKTAKIIIREEIDVLTRYKLACLNCIEDEIRKIWKQIPRDIKIRFLSNNDAIALNADRVLVVFFNHLNLQSDTAEIKSNCEITNIWTVYDICPPEQSFFQPYTPTQYGMLWATHTGNKAAIKYFFQKLQSKDREEYIMVSACSILRTRMLENSLAEAVCFPKESYSHALLFFLIKMNERQLSKVFEYYPCETLRCFLDWPCQDLNAKYADFLWKFLTFEQYKDFGLSLITDISKFRYINLEIFEYFFQNSPEIHLPFLPLFLKKTMKLPCD